MSGEIVSATLSFSFDASDTGSSAPQIRSGYSSANNIVVPKEFEGNSCVEYYHSYGESPSDLTLKGIGVLSRVESTTEYFEENLTVTGDNIISLSNDVIGVPTVTVQGGSFIEITESVVNGKIQSTKVPVQIKTLFDPVTNSIKLSTAAGDEGNYYGMLSVGYKTTKHLYKVSYENTTCPYEITDANSPSLNASNEILIIGTFSTGISTVTGSRNDKCCEDRLEKLYGDKTAVGGGLGKAEVGAGAGCTKILHVYGQDAVLSVLSGPVIAGSGSATTEQITETLLFNGSVSTSLKYTPQGELKDVRILETSTFKGTGYQAVYKAGENSSTPQKGYFIPDIPFPGLSYDAKTNSIVVNIDKSILEPKFYGSVLIKYNVDRFDHSILFSTTNCPQPDDTSERSAQREEDSKGLILLTYPDGTLSTMTMSRESACCAQLLINESGGPKKPDEPKPEPPAGEGFNEAFDDYEVKITLIALQERFEPVYDITGSVARVTEYMLMEGFGGYDFTIQGVYTNEGMFGITNPDSIFSVSVESTKLLVKVVEASEIVALSNQASGKLKALPSAPAWEKLTDLTSGSGYLGNLGIIFGCQQSYYWTGQYNKIDNTVEITGIKHLKADEFVIVDGNGVEVPVSGVIKVSYNTAIAIYRVHYSTTGPQMRKPNAQVRYVAVYKDNGWRVTGSVNSEAKTENKVSKKKVATLQELLGQ